MQQLKLQVLSPLRARAVGRGILPMRDYGKVSPFFWTRGSGKHLRGDSDAQVTALYLVTSPTANLIGLYYLPVVTIAHDTGLTAKRAREALGRVSESSFALYDFDHELAWIPNVARFEIGPIMKPGDKRRGKVLAELSKVAGHAFALEFWRIYGDAFGLGECPFEGASKGHRRGILDPRADPSPDPLLTISSPTPDPSPSDDDVRGVNVATRIREDWQPDEARKRVAVDLGIDVDIAAGEFRTYWLAVADDANAFKRCWQRAFESRLYQLAGRRGPKSPRLSKEVRQLPDRVSSWEVADETTEAAR